MTEDLHLTSLGSHAHMRAGLRLRRSCGVGVLIVAASIVCFATTQHCTNLFIN